MKMTDLTDRLYNIILYTMDQKPLLEGNLRQVVKQGFKTLTGRYPGLKLLHYAVHSNRVEMTLDLNRLDEDLPRIIQSFKSEVKGLARKNGFEFSSLWQRAYDEKEVPDFEF